MTTPLLTRDARELRLLARPRWHRRLVAWTIPIAAVVLTGLHTWSVGPVVCTTQAPCRPDPAGSVSIGLLASTAIAGLVYPRLAAWFAGGFVVSLVVSERLLRPSLVSPAWLYIVDLGLVGLCVMVAGVSRDRQPTGRALQWLAGVRRERPPAAAHLSHPGRMWRLIGWVLVAPAVACLAWGWYAQQQADARQLAATRAAAVVTAHTDEFTVRVQLLGDTASISVLDVQNYPVGEQMELYIDDLGLRQPVSEPYDATGWILLAVLLAGLAAACGARGIENGHGLRRLFDDEQPVSEVSVLPGMGIVAVYADDARPGDPALVEVRTSPVVGRDDDGGSRLTSAGLEPRVQAASLYGIPAPGHWCAVVVDGRPVVPTRPLSVKGVAAPPYGFVVADNTVADGTVADSTVSDNSMANDAVAPALRRADLPLRAEEVEALRAADREVAAGQVRFHVRSPLVGYVGAATMPLAVIVPFRLLSPAPYGVALLVAGVAVAASCAIVWRVFMRGRIAWNGRGIAVAGVIGAKVVAWRMVHGIEHDRDSVTIHAGYHSLVVGAGPMFWIFGRRDRGAEELANALRHARSTAHVDGHSAEAREKAVMDGPARDSRPDDLPHLERPRAPAGLYALWLLGTPALAWALHASSAV